MWWNIVLGWIKGQLPGSQSFEDDPCECLGLIADRSGFLVGKIGLVDNSSDFIKLQVICHDSVEYIDEVFVAKETLSDTNASPEGSFGVLLLLPLW